MGNPVLLRIPDCAMFKFDSFITLGVTNGGTGLDKGKISLVEISSDKSVLKISTWGPNKAFGSDNFALVYLNPLLGQSNLLGNKITVGQITTKSSTAYTAVMNFQGKPTKKAKNTAMNFWGEYGVKFKLGKQ